MKNYLFLLVITLSQSLVSFANIRDPHEGGICHVEAEYFYPGVWEKHGTDELICNYWKFLAEDDRQILESQLSEDGNDSEVDYGDYDSIEDMYEE